MVCVAATTYRAEALTSITGVPVIPTKGTMSVPVILKLGIAMACDPVGNEARLPKLYARIGVRVKREYGILFRGYKYDVVRSVPGNRQIGHV